MKNIIINGKERQTHRRYFDAHDIITMWSEQQDFTITVRYPDGANKTFSAIDSAEVQEGMIINVAVTSGA